MPLPGREPMESASSSAASLSSSMSSPELARGGNCGSLDKRALIAER